MNANEITQGMKVNHPKHGTYVVRDVVTNGDETMITSITGQNFYYWPTTQLTLR